MFLGSPWSANSLCCVWADDSALFFTFLPFFQQRRDELKCSKATKSSKRKFFAADRQTIASEKRTKAEQKETFEMFPISETHEGILLERILIN